MRKIYNNSVVYSLNVSGMAGKEVVTFRLHCSNLHTYQLPLSQWSTLKDAP